MKLPKTVLEEMLNHAREGKPLEICGLLAGRRASGLIEVVQAIRIRNVHPNPVKEYLLDPGEQLQAILRVEDELGFEVVGFYHSHPAGPPRFSVTDVAKATWPETAYFLVYLAPEEGYRCGIWRGAEHGFVDEPVDLV
ncbi:MAG TPA: M67 family metallopeptidase [Candidatus Thermoplasmatota archaeon]|nr:M67 family metallopeptidase [Candidatus Thermoplasmatota archaeon]